MKKEEFKKMIKESVREVLLAEGFLSTIISEVMKGVGTSVVMESSPQRNDIATEASASKTKKFKQVKQEEKTKKLHETKKRMLDAIGKDAYGGIDVFEGTTPVRKAGNASGPSAPSSPLGDVDPSDPGVDISGILGASATWKQMIK